MICGKYEKSRRRRLHRRRQVQSCQRGGELHPPPHFRAGHCGRHRRPSLYEPSVPVQKIQRRNGRVDFRLYPKRKTSRGLPPAGAHEKTACRHRLLSRLLLPKPLYPRLQKVSLPHSAGIPPQTRLRLTEGVCVRNFHKAARSASGRENNGAAISRRKRKQRS